MKLHLLNYLFVIALMFSCNKKQETTENSLTYETAHTITGLLSEADNQPGKMVQITGTVDHVCSHSGKRCFLIDEENSIRVEAMGNISKFERELTGTRIIVKGILREKQLDAQYINDWENKTLVKAETEGNSDHCMSELAEIQQMKDWMKEKNKDYYSVWYVDGTDYEVVQ